MVAAERPRALGWCSTKNTQHASVKQGDANIVSNRAVAMDEDDGFRV